MRHFKTAFFLALLIPILHGCGYRFSGEGSGPKPGLKRIAIPIFENRTGEPELGSLFAGALRQQFLTRGDLQVVPEDQAEAVFRGSITDIHTSSVAHIDVKQTIQTRLYVTLDIRCQDMETGKAIWQDPQFTYFKTYLQVPDPIASFDNRREAFEFLAKEMAIRIHDRFLSNF
ncbi:MAG: LptE family protein [Deltaproteobacteria bacterium]|nr:LptE family protein [Deltaproteobacteria bacterium]